jgi:hypothetical protein
MMLKNILSITLLYFGSISLALAEPLVDFSSSMTRMKSGETFSLDVLMHAFPNTEGGGVNLLFNPDVLQVNAVTINGNAWDFENRSGEIDNSTGSVSDILFTNYKGVAGEARIATVEFHAIGRGETTIYLSESSTNPFATMGERVSVEFGTALVRVRGGKNKK